MDQNADFLYVNRDNFWPDFQWHGLELTKDGILQLASLPLLDGELPQALRDLPNPVGPAGIAVTCNGTVYFSDPCKHQLFRIDICNHRLELTPCLGGEGSRPAQFREPRGLLFHPVRHALFVADSGNHRIQIFDLQILQLLDIWGQPDISGKPQAGGKPGRFNIPWSLVSDRVGNVYVVDYGNERVQKFNIHGEVAPTFWENLQATGLQKPTDITAVVLEEATHLYILAQDQDANWKIFLCDVDGHSLMDAQGQPITIALGNAKQPLGLAASEDAVYIGDNDQRRVLVFKRDGFKQDGSFAQVGEAVGYQGPVAGLAFDGREGLLVHTGTDIAPLRLALNKSFRTKGVLWSKAIKTSNPKVIWHRLRAEIAALAADAHLQFFLCTSTDKADPPSVALSSDNPFADPKWRAMPLDVPDLFIGNDAVCCLWIGAIFSGNGSVTPILQQIRVEFDHTTYLRYLPSIYSNDGLSQDFLVRLLALFESLFGEVENEIGNVSVLFDPNAVPKAFLPWLASWLALELDEAWDEATQRQAVAQAFELYGKRGTAEGLRQALSLFAGVHAFIEEPILNAAWWSLPGKGQAKSKANTVTSADTESWQATENSILGFTTMLVAAQPQGAVLGTSAVLDRSHLIRNEQFGAPLFEDIAHQFSVLLYRSELRCPETLQRVRAVIEQEKPAHTAYQICIIEPHMKVGFQARVGIDSIVGAPPAPMTLAGVRLGLNSVLGGAGEPDEAGQLGQNTYIGQTTFLR
jgi:phage tail-like protein